VKGRYLFSYILSGPTIQSLKLIQLICKYSVSIKENTTLVHYNRQLINAAEVLINSGDNDNDGDGKRL
jgi:hypothetical protein